MLLEDRADPDGDAELPAVDPVALSKPFLEELVIDMDIPSDDSDSSSSSGSGSSSSGSSGSDAEDDDVIYVAPPPPPPPPPPPAQPPPEEAAPVPGGDGMDNPFVVR